MIRKVMLMAAGLLGAFVLTALIVPMFLNPATLKAPIIEQIQRSTGYSIDIAGDISIRLFPEARVRLGNVTLRGAGKAASEPFAKMKQLDVGVRMLPLISGKVEVSRLSLDEPALILIKSPLGNNWTSANVPPPEASYRSQDDADAKDKAGLDPGRIVLEDVRISNGSLSYQDKDEGRHVSLAGLDLKARMDGYDGELDMDATAQWNGKPIKAELTLVSLSAMRSGKQVPLALLFESDALKLGLKGNTNTLRYEGPLELKTDSLLQAMAWLTGGKESKDAPKIAIDLKANASCMIDRCSLKDMALALNDSKLTGKADASTVGAKPTFYAELATPQLDITPYLAAEKKTSSLSLVSDAHAAGRWSSKEYDFSAFNLADGSISIVADEFIARQFKTGKITLRAKTQGGTLSFDAISQALYSGSGNITANISSAGTLDGRVILEKVAFGPLLDATIDNNRLSGLASMGMIFNTRGLSQQAWVGNLGGGGNLKMEDGSIRGIDIAGMIRNTKASFTGADAGGSQKTDFAELLGTLQIAGGIITNNDLSMKAPLFRVAGAGTVNLPAYTMNYKLTPQLVDTLKGQGGKDKTGLAVPILITGPLDNLRYAPDARGVVEEAIKDPKKFRENLKETGKDMKGLLKEGKSFLKGL